MRVAASTLVLLGLLVSACDNGSPAASSPATQAGTSTEALYAVDWPTDGETFVGRLVEKQFEGARRVAVKCRSLQRNTGSCDATWRGAQGERCNASLSVHVTGPHEFGGTTGLANCTGAADFDFVTASP